MKERPILFNSEMVKAILDGRKTQTMRIIKPQPTFDSVYDHPFDDEIDVSWKKHENLSIKEFRSLCPFGKVGDRLWVRETFNTTWGDRGTILYKADGGSAAAAGYSSEPKWSPSIHMPKWASRITLEITDIKVERLQDISEEDARAEGVTSKQSFKSLWESISGEESWNKNPWVWVISFRRIK